MSFKLRFEMQTLANFEQALTALQRSYTNFLQLKNKSNFEDLKLDILRALEVYIEAKINLNFLYINPTFERAWDLFIGYKEPNGQHPSNVIYLWERLTPD